MDTVVRDPGISSSLHHFATVLHFHLHLRHGHAAAADAALSSSSFAAALATSFAIAATVDLCREGNRHNRIHRVGRRKACKARVDHSKDDIRIIDANGTEHQRRVAVRIQHQVFKRTIHNAQGRNVGRNITNVASRFIRKECRGLERKRSNNRGILSMERYEVGVRSGMILSRMHAHQKASTAASVRTLTVMLENSAWAGSVSEKNSKRLSTSRMSRTTMFRIWAGSVISRSLATCMTTPKHGI